MSLICPIWLTGARGYFSSYISLGGPPRVASSVRPVVLTGYQLPGEHHRRGSAILANGYSTGWSPVRSYTVNGLHPAPLTSPANSFDAAVREVVLDWGPVPGAVTYELEIGTDINFLSDVHRRTGIVGTRYSPPDGLGNDEYYWRVRPVDASDNPAPWPPQPWHFRRAWPEQPDLVHPHGDVAGDVPFFYEWDAIEMASDYAVVLYDATGRQLCAATTVHTTLANAYVPRRQVATCGRCSPGRRHRVVAQHACVHGGQVLCRRDLDRPRLQQRHRACDRGPDDVHVLRADVPRGHHLLASASGRRVRQPHGPERDRHVRAAFTHPRGGHACGRRRARRRLRLQLDAPRLCRLL